MQALLRVEFPVLKILVEVVGVFFFFFTISNFSWICFDLFIYLYSKIFRCGSSESLLLLIF